jgi:hypothetical protein
MSNTSVCVNCTYSRHILLHSVVTVHYKHCMYNELSSMPYILQHSNHVTRYDMLQEWDALNQEIVCIVHNTLLVRIWDWCSCQQKMYWRLFVLEWPEFLQNTLPKAWWYSCRQAIEVFSSFKSDTHVHTFSWRSVRTNIQSRNPKCMACQFIWYNPVIGVNYSCVMCPISV